MSQGNEILFASDKDGVLSWAGSVRSVLESNSMLNFYINHPEIDYLFIFTFIIWRILISSIVFNTPPTVVIPQTLFTAVFPTILTIVFLSYLIQFASDPPLMICFPMS